MTGDPHIDERILGAVHVTAGRAHREWGVINESSLHWEIVKDLGGTAGVGVGSMSVDDEWLVRDGVPPQGPARRGGRRSGR